ncbi:autophagy protein Apg6-domain-containing protein [Phyllosticta citrichinensis]|uniref:Autophagy protein Apg6-domain-containing protein n=1 Tax=Phyllosticta citrichinensis TaxID=1130410 RepID=A0ABR1Y2R3_9PEZI
MYCQKCRTPVKLDPSLEDLNPAAFKLITDSIGPSAKQRSLPLHQSRPTYSQDRRDAYDRVANKATTPIFKRTVPSSRGGRESNHHPSMSFVMLTESQVVPQGPHKVPGDGHGAAHDTFDQTMSHKMETVQRLFEVLSARSDIDHPICLECTELLVELLQMRLSTATKERDAYVEYLRQANANIPTEEEQQQAKKNLEEVKKQEGSSFKELERLEREKAAMDEEIAKLDEEAQELDKEEEAFWRERNAFAVTLATFQSERDRINNRFDHDTKQVRRLQRTNVYNDTFTIGHDGIFATINGLRLGRTSAAMVGWDEINAAWGQTCLLLATVADKAQYTFKGYKLCPMGSTSTIEKHDYPQSASTDDPAHPPKPKITVLELYCSGDMPLGLGFLHRRFDSAMVAFLECLRQIHESCFKLPYTIRKDKIRDQSIKLSFNQEETWTRACKDTLICCKYLLAATSDMDQQQRTTRRQG